MSDDIYHTREVRDLAWACFSPPLMLSHDMDNSDQNIANCGLGLSPERRRWLHSLDRSPAPLHTHLNQLHNSRLGLYFESLWHFFLMQDPLVDLLAHNLAVRSTEKTVGEFDCLYYCHQRKRHFHLELAVKYYLGRRAETKAIEASRWSQWLGPNNKDNLERKINHLIQHQIRLSDHPAAQNALQELGIVSPAKEIEIKGYLFQSLSAPIQAPTAFNPKQQLCHWVTIDQVEDFLPTLGTNVYSILDKSHWLASARTHTCHTRPVVQSSLVALLNSWFASDNRPQLIAAFNHHEVEKSRFFVTPNNWPSASA